MYGYENWILYEGGTSHENFPRVFILRKNQFSADFYFPLGLRQKEKNYKCRCNAENEKKITKMKILNNIKKKKETLMGRPHYQAKKI